MTGCRPEVADVIRKYGKDFVGKHATTSQQRRVLLDLSTCRTKALGGHVLRCDRCQHTEISYNSCRNRHCPKCQAAARAAWLEDRRKDLIAVPYFHVVFTLPHELSSLVLQNKRQLYSLLFRAAAEAMKETAANDRHLGAQVGFLAVLHTWGQTLHHHPHIHCVVPAGGLSNQGTAWIDARKDFFLPVRVLSKLFRGKYMSALDSMREAGQLQLHGRAGRLNCDPEWSRFRARLFSKNWVVYAKRPFGGPEQVLKYLARYTHRVAIANQGIVAAEHGRVSFRWKSYANGSVQRIMTLTAVQFLQRFLLHVLPKHFVRIRQYGFLANRIRHDKLERIRQLLDPTSGDRTQAPDSPTELQHAEREISAIQISSRPCPACTQGKLIILGELRPLAWPLRAASVRAPP